MVPPASLGASVTSRGCSARPVLLGTGWVLAQSQIENDRTDETDTWNNGEGVAWTGSAGI